MPHRIVQELLYIYIYIDWFPICFLPGKVPIFFFLGPTRNLWEIEMEYSVVHVEF